MGLFGNKRKSKKEETPPPVGEAPGPTPDRKEMKSIKKKLTKVKTKEGGAAPERAEVKAYAKIYDSCKGDNKKIGKKLGIKIKKDAKFKDGKAFAKSLLAGLCVEE